MNIAFDGSKLICKAHSAFTVIGFISLSHHKQINICPTGIKESECKQPRKRKQSKQTNRTDEVKVYYLLRVTY